MPRLVIASARHADERRLRHRPSRDSPTGSGRWDAYDAVWWRFAGVTSGQTPGDHARTHTAPCHRPACDAGRTGAVGGGSPGQLGGPNIAAHQAGGLPGSDSMDCGPAYDRCCEGWTLDPAPPAGLLALLRSCACSVFPSRHLTLVRCCTWNLSLPSLAVYPPCAPPQPESPRS